MRKIFDIATDQWLREVVSDYEGSGISPDLYIQYGDLQLTERWEQGDWQISDKATGWNLSMDIWGRLPGSAFDYQNANLAIVGEFAGALVKLLDAPVSTPKEMPDHTTNILAGTPGVLADKIPLREPVEYINRSPKWVIRDALYRIPYYDKGHISIPEFELPIIDRRLINGDGFEDSAYPKDILTAMKDITKCVYNDTPINRGHTVSRDIATGEGQQVVWHFSESDDKQIAEEFENPEPAAPDEQYTKVVVRDRFDDGTIRIWEEAEVDYSLLRYPPPPGRILFVDYKATDPLDPLTAQTARARVVEEARSLRRLIHFGSLVVHFNFFIEPGDVITISSTREDDVGYFDLTWRCVVEGVAHRFGGSESILTEITYRAVLAQETRVAHLPLFLPGVSTQVADTESLVP